MTILSLLLACYGNPMEGYVDNQMGSDEYGRLANYTRRQYPDVLEAQVREQPWFVKALGNPIVLGTLGVITSKLLGRR